MMSARIPSASISSTAILMITLELDCLIWAGMLFYAKAVSPFLSMRTMLMGSSTEMISPPAHTLARLDGAMSVAYEIWRIVLCVILLLRSEPHPVPMRLCGSCWAAAKQTHSHRVTFQD